MSKVDLDHVERTMLVIAERLSLPLIYHDPADGQRHTVTPQSLSSRVGFLPAVINAGEAVWRQATGKGFALDIVRDPEALLGYQLRGIRGGTFSTVLLSSMEALHQVSYPNAILVNELNSVWAFATSQTRHDAGPSPTARKAPQP